MNATPGRPPAGAGLAAWLAYQERLHAQPIALGLERVRRVAARLELLEDGPPTLTVAGTNGKGSAATLAGLALTRAGHRTGVYTSPHLRRYNERIAIDGMPVDDARLVAAFERIEAARGDVALTYFEFGTLAALEVFRTAGVAARVLEVGLGGRLDAVNIVDADVALITSIGLDHTDWLGDTREAIGFEKAGILRPGAPAICAEPDPPASIAAHAEAIGAELQQLGRDLHCEPQAGGWILRADRQSLRLPQTCVPVPPATLAGAVAALLALRRRLPIGDDAIRTALAELRMPGRCERRAPWVFDVSHNAEAAAVLASFLRAQGRTPPRWRLVLGMLADKPVEAYCAALADTLCAAHFAPLPVARGLTAAQLKQRAAAAGVEGRAHASVADALQAARQTFDLAQGHEDGIVVCGSFVTVEQALEALA